MRSETQPYSTVIAIRLCRTAHAIFFPKFWNDKKRILPGFSSPSHREGPGTEVETKLLWLHKRFLKTNISNFINKPLEENFLEFYVLITFPFLNLETSSLAISESFASFDFINS